MIFYSIPNRCGLDAVRSIGDGYTTELTWFQAYTNLPGHAIGYHIYFSTEKENVFSEGVKFVVIDGSLSANIINFVPGQLMWYSVRPIEFAANTLINNFTITLINNELVVLLISDIESELPLAYDNLRVYPSSILRSNISATDLTIPLEDTTNFAVPGIIRVGGELIQYSLIDRPNNNIILTNVSQRGYQNTIAAPHTIDGYDGGIYWNPEVSFFIAGESSIFDRIFMGQTRFEYPNFPFTQDDGYRQVLVDDLNTDLSASDADNVDFPPYDYSGYHRTDPIMLIDGTCVGSYIGGEWGCIGPDGSYNIYRGTSIQDQINQKEEILLSMTGRPAVLIKRIHTGITCSCYLATSEYADDRCFLCMGTKFVIGYQQYFNPRRSDGRIMVRLSPADDGVKQYESGMESELNLDVWTQTVPTIHQRDIILLFDVNGNREFMYEVGLVSRNNTVLGQEGAQKMKLIRIRKTDPAYQIRIFDDTSMFPSDLATSITTIPGTIPPHSHTIRLSEKITNVSQINQFTSFEAGHSHAIVDGIVMESLGHNHNLVI